jgi:coenzyme Q-binding protein COQ10
MPGFRAKRRVHHSADQMFDLVADVEHYPEFVPLCQRHTIASRKKCGDSEIVMTDMTVAYQFFRETHRSRVTLDRAAGRILVESIDGPLRRLRTLWTFQPKDEDSCDVGFDLSYEFASPTLALLLGGVLDAAFGRFVQAFESRADVVYGRCERPLDLTQQILKSSNAKVADTDRSPGQLYAVKPAFPSRPIESAHALDLNQ